MNKNKERKKKYQKLAITVMMLISILSQVLGEKGQWILDFAAFIGLIVIGVVILYLFINGYTSIALIFLAMGVPLAVTGWGFYIDNITIAFFGLGSFFIIIFLIVILQKLNFLD